MSDDLVKRLREDVFYGDERLHNLSRHNPLHMEAADRIEELDAVSALDAERLRITIERAEMAEDERDAATGGEE